MNAQHGLHTVALVLQLQLHVVCALFFTLGLLLLHLPTFFVWVTTQKYALNFLYIIFVFAPTTLLCWFATLDYFYNCQFLVIYDVDDICLKIIDDANELQSDSALQKIARTLWS